MCVVETKKKRDGEGKVVDWCVHERKLERGGREFVEDERERVGEQ